MNDYNEDILTWSERQADLLRRRAEGEPVNENEIDWRNVAEEIVDVGISALRAVRSHIQQALFNDLQASAWPLSLEVPRWQAEARGHRDDARDEYKASMAGRIDMAKLYRQALRRMPDTVDGEPPIPMPRACPVTLEQLLADEP